MLKRRAYAAALCGIMGFLGGIGWKRKRTVSLPEQLPSSPAPVLKDGETPSKKAHRQNQLQQRRKP